MAGKSPQRLSSNGSQLTGSYWQHPEVLFNGSCRAIGSWSTDSQTTISFWAPIDFCLAFFCIEIMCIEAVIRGQSGMELQRELCMSTGVADKLQIPREPMRPTPPLFCGALLSPAWSTGKSSSEWCMLSYPAGWRGSGLIHGVTRRVNTMVFHTWSIIVALLSCWFWMHQE